MDVATVKETPQIKGFNVLTLWGPDSLHSRIYESIQRWSASEIGQASIKQRQGTAWPKKKLKSYIYFRERAKGEPSNSRSFSFIWIILKALEHILWESIIKNREVNRTVRFSVTGCTKRNRQLAVVRQLYIVLACNKGKENMIDLINVDFYEVFQFMPLWKNT